MRDLPGYSFMVFALVIAVAACAPAAAPAPTAAPTKPAPAAPAAPASPAAAPAPPAAAAPPAAQPAAKSATGLEEARAQAQAKGLLFAASHDEIVTKAKQESGVMKAQGNTGAATNKAFKEGFTKLYPWANVDVDEITGTDAGQRFLLEVKAGRAQDQDVVSVPSEFFPEWGPYLEAIDTLGMAEQGVLAIPPRMVSTTNRQMVGMSTMFGVVVYNKNLLPADRVPKQWEDLLKPEWKGRKMIAEIRVHTMAALVPAQGEEWVKDYAAKIAAQEPVWARGQTAALTRIAAGEYPLHSLNYYESAYSLIQKGSDSLAIQVIEPIPTYPNVVLGIQKGSKRPYTSLLYLEYVAGPEGQKIMDEVEIAKGSLYAPGTLLNHVVAGKKLSEVGWGDFEKMSGWEKSITAAYGFPKAEGP